jgi:hypothetical protein
MRSVLATARYTWWLLIAAAVVALVGWLRGCWPFAGDNQADMTASPKTSVAEWLDYCSPFETLSGQRALTFFADRSVIAAEAPPDEKQKGALVADHPQEHKGVWGADEETRRVFVEFDGAKSEYALLISFSEDQCILVSGSLTAADLTSSLFGIPSFPEPDE